MKNNSYFHKNFNPLCTRWTALEKLTRTQTINRAKSEGNQKIPKDRSMNHKISYCIILQRLNVVHTKMEKIHF